MENLFFTLLLISFACLVAGLIKPRSILRFLRGDKTRKNVVLIFGTATVLFFFLFGSITTPPSWLEKQSEEESSLADESSPVDEKETKKEPLKDPKEESPDDKEPAEEPREEEPKPEIYGISIGGVAKTNLLQLIPWSDGAVSINMPLGWNIYTGGECATKSILARDPFTEVKQVFYFSEAGPVYTNQELKTRDYNYIQMGGYNIPWFESPIVNPLTAENYLTNFSVLALTSFFQQAFPQVPVMTNIKIISAKEIADKPVYITDAKLIRAEFQQNGKSGEGSFYIITADMGMGLGYGMMFIGITAPNGLLDLIIPSLEKSLESYTINQEYVNVCIDAGNKAAAGALKAGRILSESSDVIMDVWENKLEAEQRMSEKYNDAILGSSRLYNPDTDEVYEITPEFYDHYGTHSNEFEMNYLEELPDDKWSYAPLNGAEHIK